MYRNFFLFFIVFMGSCAGSLPKDVLPPEKMEQVLWDVARGGEYASGYLYPKYPATSKMTIDHNLLNEILRAHHITKKQFDKSLDFYQKKPEMLLRVLDSISANAAEWTKLDKPPVEEEKKDTIAVVPPPSITPEPPRIPATVQ